MHSGEDSAIIRRVLEGDTNAFEVLVHRYRPLVFGVVLKYVPSDRADDVAQETFIEAFRSLGSFAEKSPFSHWLSRIAARCSYRFWRQQRGSREIPVSSLSADSEQWLDSVTSGSSREAFEREAERDEAAEVLEHALSRLSAEDRMVLTMVHLDGLSVREAAEQLGWSAVSVKVRAFRSRQKLRKIVSDLIEGKGKRRGGL